MVDIDEDIGSSCDNDIEPAVNDLDDMKRTLESLQQQLQVKSEQLEAAVADMDKMRRVTQSLVDGPEAAAPMQDVERSVSGCRTENEDSNYATSYGKIIKALGNLFIQTLIQIFLQNDKPGNIEKTKPMSITHSVLFIENLL